MVFDLRGADSVLFVDDFVGTLLAARSEVAVGKLITIKALKPTDIRAVKNINGKKRKAANKRLVKSYTGSGVDRTDV